MYRRRYRKRKYPKRSRISRYLSTGAKALMVGSSALRIAKQVKNLVNVEFKHHEVSSSLTCVGTGHIISLSSVAQGDSQTTRDGDSIRGKSLQIRIRMGHNASGGTGQTVRMILFIDKQNNQPGTCDPTLSGTPYGVLNQSTLQSLTLPENSGRYKILKDKMYTMTNDIKELIDLKIYKKINPKITFTSSSTNVAQKNNIYMLVFSNEATNGPSFAYATRLRYIDN